MNQWIPVKDRLPDILDDVLVFVQGKFNNKIYKCILISFRSEVYDSNFKEIEIEWNCYSVNNEIVTHWMPLPEVPNES